MAPQGATRRAVKWDTSVFKLVSIVSWGESSTCHIAQRSLPKLVLLAVDKIDHRWHHKKLNVDTTSLARLTSALGRASIGLAQILLLLRISICFCDVRCGWYAFGLFAQDAPKLNVYTTSLARLTSRLRKSVYILAYSKAKNISVCFCEVHCVYTHLDVCASVACFRKFPLLQLHAPNLAIF